MAQEIIVIGAGASGMTAAIAAARGGAHVRLLEHKNRPGKKILSTGNGKCNLTNQNQNPCFYRTSSNVSPFSVIQKFGWQEAVCFFESIGVLWKEKNGYVYPRSAQASSVLDGLRFALREEGVSLFCEQRIRQVRPFKNGFYVDTDGKTLRADKVILACGGKTAPSTGSDGSGYHLCRTFGHTIVRTVPALTFLTSSYDGCKTLAGIRTDASVTLYCGGKAFPSEFGEVQLTKDGLSGIPVFQISRYASYSLSDGLKTECVLDFLPEFSFRELLSYLDNQITRRPNCPAGELLCGILPKNLWLLLLKEAGIRPSGPSGQIISSQKTALFQKAKAFSFPITGTGSLDKAQVTAGGVRLDEVNLHTMESFRQKGLYVVGELLDTDGICGGYNLQWAWATGFLAGFHSASGKEFEKGAKSCF